MPSLELTDRFCKAAKSADGQQTDFFDTVVKGLSLLVSPGGTKTFFLFYTKPSNGKRARLKMGRYPEISLGKAREKARNARAAINEGTDPVAEIKSTTAAQTVADLVESYVVRQASKAKRGDEIARRLNHDVVRHIGDVKLSELHRRDLTRCIDAIMDRGAPAGANRLFDDIRAMVRWAKARGDLDENLVEGMRRPAEPVERDRVLSGDEIKTVWAMLANAEMWESTRRVLRLCLITAQRVGEVCSITQDQIDFDRMIWTIPAAVSKNGREHAVPLSAMAVDVLRDQLEASKTLAKRKGRAVPPFIFSGPGGRASVGRAAISRAVKRQEDNGNTLGVESWTPHDLRRTAATHMEELGISPFVIAHALNHVSITKASITSRVYARYDYVKEKRAALELWAEKIKDITEDNLIR